MEMEENKGGQRAKSCSSPAWAKAIGVFENKIGFQSCPQFPHIGIY